MVRELYKAYIDFCNRIKWRIKIRNIQSLIGCSHDTGVFHTEGDILVIAPHADDELIGCHQMMVNHSSQVTVFYCGFLGSNLNENNRKKRKKEFVEYVQTIGVNFFLSTPDHLIEDLEDTIITLSPSFVFLPSFVDWHPEHRKINDICIPLFERYIPNSKVCWYHVSMPIPRDYITIVSNLTRKQHECKWELMKNIYKSQLHMNIKRFRFVESLHADGSNYAETYILLSLSNWQEAINTLSGMIKELDSLKIILGEIDIMYIRCYNIYAKIFNEK